MGKEPLDISSACPSCPDDTAEMQLLLSRLKAVESEWHDYPDYRRGLRYGISALLIAGGAGLLVMLLFGVSFAVAFSRFGLLWLYASGGIGALSWAVGAFRPSGGGK